LGLLVPLVHEVQVAQGFLALGPLGPTLGVFGLGMFVGAKTQIVTMGKRMVEIVGKKDG
jgi:hypothetical protein